MLKFHEVGGVETRIHQNQTLYLILSEAAYVRCDKSAHTVSVKIDVGHVNVWNVLKRIHHRIEVWDLLKNEIAYVFRISICFGRFAVLKLEFYYRVAFLGVASGLVRIPSQRRIKAARYYYRLKRALAFRMGDLAVNGISVAVENYVLRRARSLLYVRLADRVINRGTRRKGFKYLEALV